MVRLKVIEGGLLPDADRAGAIMHRHMFDMVLRAAYGTAMKQPRMTRTLPLLLKLERRFVEDMLARSGVHGRVDDMVLAQAMAMGLGEGLRIVAPNSPAVDLFIEPTVLVRSPSIFHVVSRGVPYWNDLTRDGPAQGVHPVIEDVHAFYRDTLLEARHGAAERCAVAHR